MFHAFMLMIVSGKYPVECSSMRAKRLISRRRQFSIRVKLRKMIKCVCSREQLSVDEMSYSSESLATRDYSASGYSSRPGESETKVDNSNIEEAESSLRESGYLNYEVRLKNKKFLSPFIGCTVCID